MTRLLPALIVALGSLGLMAQGAVAQPARSAQEIDAAPASSGQAQSAQSARPMGPPPLTVISPESAFAARMVKRLSAAYPQASFRSSRKDPLLVEVSGAEWIATQIYLHRVFAYCETASAADCEAASQRMVAAVGSPPPTARPQNLRVIVRGKDYIAYAQAKAAKEKQPWFFVRKIGDDLYEALALDGPNVIALASAADLKDMKLKPDEAWALGRRQTSAIVPPMPEPGAYLSDTVTFEGPEYISAVLADTDYWQGLRDLIGPDLFITVTSDQFVLASLLEAGPAMDRFAEAVAEDCKNAERCISPHIYRFEDGMWVIEK